MFLVECSRRLWQNRVARYQRDNERDQNLPSKLEKLETRVSAHEVRLSKIDRRIESIAKLIQTGMKMMVENQKGIRDLRAAQRETDRMLREFIRSMGRGGPTNGHSKKTGIQ